MKLRSRPLAVFLFAAVVALSLAACSSATSGSAPDPAAASAASARASQSSVAAAQSAIASEVASQSAAADAPCTSNACIAETAEQSLPGAVAGDNSVVTRAACYKRTVVHHAEAGDYTVKCRAYYSDGTSVTGLANVLLDQDKITFQPTG